jgi:hypothetical protein
VQGGTGHQRGGGDQGNNARAKEGLHANNNTTQHGAAQSAVILPIASHCMAAPLPRSHPSQPAPFAPPCPVFLPASDLHSEEGDVAYSKQQQH